MRQLLFEIEYRSKSQTKSGQLIQIVLKVYFSSINKVNETFDFAYELNDSLLLEAS